MTTQTIGYTLEGLKKLLTKYKAERYIQRDFRDVTILYYRGDSQTKRGVAEYYPLRPCDVDGYKNDVTIDTAPIEIKFDDIPDEILSQLGSDEKDCKAYNIAFMFEEGTPEQEIFFLHPAAVHAMLRLPIEKTNVLSFARMHLLADNLFRANDAVQPRLTIASTKKGKMIIGFSSDRSMGSFNSIDYIEQFLKTTDSDVCFYCDSITNITVVLKAKIKNSTSDLIPCYALTLSDSGHGAPTLSCGWIYKDIPDFYIQNKTIALADIISQDDDTEIDEEQIRLSMENAITVFEQALEQDNNIIQAKVNRKINVSKPGSKNSVASKLATSMPNFQKHLSSKLLHEVYKELEDCDVESEYQMRTTMLQLLYLNKKASNSSKTYLHETGGAKLLGIS